MLAYKIEHHPIKQELSAFKPISLDEINRVKLMDRLDFKYLTERTKLQSLLTELSGHFYALEINNCKEQEYASVYLDTNDYDMYFKHHNGRANRYKIRQRAYLSSGDRFLEIKKKNNKGVTKKVRICTEDVNKISFQDNEFIIRNTSYNGFMLEPVLSNHFFRTTLVNERFTQRITIDTDISFKHNGNEVSLPEIVIIEVKTLRQDKDKSIFHFLEELNIYPRGMSKYCIGLAMTDSNIKSNLFKTKINLINKIQKNGRLN